MRVCVCCLLLRRAVPQTVKGRSIRLFVDGTFQRGVVGRADKYYPGGIIAGGMRTKSCHAPRVYCAYRAVLRLRLQCELAGLVLLWALPRCPLRPLCACHARVPHLFALLPLLAGSLGFFRGWLTDFRVWSFARDVVDIAKVSAQS